MEQVKELLLKGIVEVTPAVWKSLVEKVKNEVEPHFWQVDEMVEREIEPVITFSSNSEDDKDAS